MIVSVTQIRLLLENVMRITPSDQPSNSDLSYRTGRWITIATVRLVGPSANWRLVKRTCGAVSLGNRQQAGKEIEMTIPKQFARLVPPI